MKLLFDVFFGNKCSNFLKSAQLTGGSTKIFQDIDLTLSRCKGVFVGVVSDTPVDILVEGSNSKLITHKKKWTVISLSKDKIYFNNIKEKYRIIKVTTAPSDIDGKVNLYLGAY